MEEPAATEPVVEKQAEVVPAAAPVVQDSTITISAVGDCTLGDPAGSENAPGSFHKRHEDEGSDYARPFSGVMDILGKDDLTIANLEGTLTTAAHRTDTTFAFRGRPDFAQMLVKGSVDAVSLANNHSFDCGNLGLLDTRKSLQTAGVGYFGLGDVDVRTVKGIEVRNLGFTGGRIDVRGEMERAVRKNKRDDNLVIVSFHWGIEGINDATDVQVALGRAAIRAGADLVLGHHPHVLQGIERYQDKTIVYSLGNFVFGGNGHPSDMDSMIFQATFTKKDGKVVPAGQRIVPVHFSGTKPQNDFRPVLIEGTEADRVRAKVDGFSKRLASGS